MKSKAYNLVYNTAMLLACRNLLQDDLFNGALTDKQNEKINEVVKILEKIVDEMRVEIK